MNVRVPRVPGHAAWISMSGSGSGKLWIRSPRVMEVVEMWTPKTGCEIRRFNE